jgi:FkbM family methyltransferase
MDEIDIHTRLHRPGTIVDVGAHDGLLTVPFSRLPGSRVLAFEPLPRAFSRLVRAVADAHGGSVPPHVELHPEALGDHTGEITLSLPVLDGEAQEQWASTAKDYKSFEGRRISVERLRVPLRTLDSFALTDVTHMKVDAEGAEYEVFRGATETLRRCRPLITSEIEERHRLGSTWAVPAFLDALGYDTFFHLSGRWFPVAALDRATMQRASPDPSVFEASDPYVFVFLSAPRERSAEILAVLG